MAEIADEIPVTEPLRTNPTPGTKRDASTAKLTGLAHARQIKKRKAEIRDEMLTNIFERVAWLMKNADKQKEVIIRTAEMMAEIHKRMNALPDRGENDVEERKDHLCLDTMEGETTNGKTV